MNICSKCKYKKGWKWIKEQNRFAEAECGIWHSEKKECEYFNPKRYLRLFYKKIKK